MASTHELVKTFIRAATTLPNGQPVGDLALATARLNQLILGQYESVITSDGVTQVSSQVGDTAFAFQVDRELSRAGLLAIAERALELLETCSTVAQARAAFLRRTTTTSPDFSGLSL